MRTLFDLERHGNNDYLKGEDNRVDREPPVELFVKGVNRWFSFADWPVPGARGGGIHRAATTATGRRSRPDPRISARWRRGTMCGSPPVPMKLFAATDGRDTDFVAKLVDVHPDGMAINVAEGIPRASMCAARPTCFCPVTAFASM